MKKYLLLLLTGCLILGGCAILSKDKTNANLLEPQPVFKFNDVPVPVGFKFVAQDSYSFETQGVRVGLLKYSGKADTDQVVNFYREQMAMYNWTLLNVVEYGQRLMNFDREQETCIINLQPNGRHLMITIAVGPKTPQASKRTRPIK